MLVIHNRHRSKLHWLHTFSINETQNYIQTLKFKVNISVYARIFTLYIYSDKKMFIFNGNRTLSPGLFPPGPFPQQLSLDNFPVEKFPHTQFPPKKVFLVVQKG